MTVMKLNELNFDILQHPTYSTSNLFPLLQTSESLLSGKTFTNTADIENAINDFIDSKNSYFFKIGI